MGNTMGMGTFIIHSVFIMYFFGIIIYKSSNVIITVRVIPCSLFLLLLSRTDCWRWLSLWWGSWGWASSTSWWGFWGWFWCSWQFWWTPSKQQHKSRHPQELDMKLRLSWGHTAVWSKSLNIVHGLTCSHNHAIYIHFRSWWAPTSSLWPLLI